jgi:hypothetical protein
MPSGRISDQGCQLSPSRPNTVPRRKSAYLNTPSASRFIATPSSGIQLRRQIPNHCATSQFAIVRLTSSGTNRTSHQA